MRARSLAWALLLVTAGLAGCIGTDDGGEQANVDQNSIVPEIPDPPSGATVETLENGVRLVFESVDLPFEQEIPVPEGTTMVRASTELPGDGFPFVRLEHADTGRRRCNVQYTDPGWFNSVEGENSCAGLTAVDPLPTNWTVNVLGPADTTADLVTIEYLNVPLDGPVSKLDLSQLSMPTHEVNEPEPVSITTHDGEELYAEVTVPEGDGPWPVILASSPYNGPAHVAGEPAMWEYFVHDWAKRGYAVVVADVRGTGYSGGCMEVWGPNETQDQKVLVDWVAEQDFSNGNVGFYGQSYVGTTPVEAAVQAPEALKAIIAVAPVNNAYDDWHFGGVPNGENLGSPLVGYQLGTGTLDKLDTGDPATTAMHAANGVCDPTLTARANDPQAVYDDYYEVRNFSARSVEIDAAVLYTHGYEDVNVKSQMAKGFFNTIETPKLGIFGHWVHQHPVRADNEVLFLAWMDEHVKGKEMGFEAIDPVLATTNVGTQRTGDTWPPADPAALDLFPDLSAGELTDTPTEGSTDILLEPTGALLEQTEGTVPGTIELTGTVEERTYIAGNPHVRLAVSLQGIDNAYVAAWLYDEGPNETREITFGMANLAHREGHDTYTSVPPAQLTRMALPMLPTEYVLEPGHELVLHLRGAIQEDWSTYQQPGKPGMLTVHAGQAGTSLHLPVLEDPQDTARPVTSWT